MDGSDQWNNYSQPQKRRRKSDSSSNDKKIKLTKDQMLEIVDVMAQHPVIWPVNRNSDLKYTGNEKEKMLQQLSFKINWTEFVIIKHRIFVSYENQMKKGWPKSSHYLYSRHEILQLMCSGYGNPQAVAEERKNQFNAVKRRGRPPKTLPRKDMVNGDDKNMINAQVQEKKPDMSYGTEHEKYSITKSNPIINLSALHNPSQHPLENDFRSLNSKYNIGNILPMPIHNNTDRVQLNNDRCYINAMLIYHNLKGFDDNEQERIMVDINNIILRHKNEKVKRASAFNNFNMQQQ